MQLFTLAVDGPRIRNAGIIFRDACVMNTGVILVNAGISFGNRGVAFNDAGIRNAAVDDFGPRVRVGTGLVMGAAAGKAENGQRG